MMPQNQWLGQSYGGGKSLYLGGSYPLSDLSWADRRPSRERLVEQKTQNTDRIAELEAKNREIDSALAMLDDHPVIERLQDLLRKILG